MLGQTAETSADGADLTEYLAILRRRWLWVLLSALLAGVLGAAMLSARPASSVRYTATTTLAPAVAENSSQSTIEAEAELVRSDKIASRALDALGLLEETPASILTAVMVSVPTDAALIDIDFTADSAQAASAGSQAFAQAYLADRLALLESDHQARIDRLTVEINKITEELSTATALAVVSDEESEERENALAVSSVLQTQLSRLRTERSLVIVEDIPDGEIVRSDEVIEKRSRELPTVPLVAAAVGFGGLAGLLLAFVADRIDPRVRSAMDAERAAGVVSLAQVPHTTFAFEPGIVPLEFSRAATSISSIALAARTNSVVIAPLLEGARSSAALPNLVSGHLAAGRPATFLAIDSADNPMVDIDSSELTVVSSVAVGAHPAALINELGPGGSGTLVMAASNTFLSRPAAVEAAAAARFLVLLVRVGTTKRSDIRTAVEMATNTDIENVRVVVEERPKILSRFRR